MQQESGLLQGSCGSLHSSPQSAHVALPFKQPVKGGAVLLQSTPPPQKKKSLKKQKRIVRAGRGCWLLTFAFWCTCCYEPINKLWSPSWLLKVLYTCQHMLSL